MPHRFPYRLAAILVTVTTLDAPARARRAVVVGGTAANGLAKVVGARAGEIEAPFLRANLGGRVGTTQIHGNDARQLALGCARSLSRRTARYAHASRIDNDGSATFVITGGPAGIVGGKTSTGFGSGRRHTF